MVKLVTKEIEEMFKKIGSQENNPDPIVVVKFFNPSGPGTWFATELHYVLGTEGNGEKPEVVEIEASKMDDSLRSRVCDMMFYGYVSIHGDHCDEWGYFSLGELLTVKCPPFGLGIERDIWFESQPISKVCPKAIGG